MENRQLRSLLLEIRVAWLCKNKTAGQRPSLLSIWHPFNDQLQYMTGFPTLSFVLRIISDMRLDANTSATYIQDPSFESGHIMGEAED